MDKNHINTKEITIGLVGLGLMRCSISTCLLMAGHNIIALAPIPDDMLNKKTGGKISGKCCRAKTRCYNSY